MDLLNLVRDQLPDLAANRYVLNTGLLCNRVFEVVLLVESRLVVKQDDVLASKPLSYVLLTLTTRPLAHLKLDRQLLAFCRVVITPDDQVLSIHALEFLSEGLYLLS